MILVTKRDIALGLSEIFASSTDASVRKSIDILGKTAEHFARAYALQVGFGSIVKHQNKKMEKRGVSLF